jgi:hypothetical protein
MPITDWLDVMPSTVTLEKATSVNDYGKPTTFAAPATYRARISFKRHLVRSRVNGEDVLATGAVWLAGVAEVSAFDRLTLPGNLQPDIVDWQTVYDENGPHHTKISFRG